jgi:hypothetical protein
MSSVDKRMNRPNPEAGSDIWSLTFKESKTGRKLTRYEMHTHALLLCMDTFESVEALADKTSHRWH